VDSIPLNLKDRHIKGAAAPIEDDNTLTFRQLVPAREKSCRWLRYELKNADASALGGRPHSSARARF
jgi:hypothetical protein